MPSIELSLSYADNGSGPKASGIGWVDWGNFSISPGETYSVTIHLLNNLIMTFNLTNTINSGSGFTILSDMPMPNSSFGTLGYTNAPGKIALEAFTDYYASTVNSSTFTLSNISVKDSKGNSVPGYSLVLASIQVSSSFIATSYQETQKFTTNGSDWDKLAWFGNASSPTVVATDEKTLTITTTSSTSGSPVYTTNASSNVSVTLTADVPQTQFSLGVAVASLTLQKVINGRISTLDQFTLSITGSESDIVTTTGTINGLQSAQASVNGPVQSTYTINESIAPGSVSTLTDYTQAITWVNNSPDGNPAPTTGYLGQSITIDVGDDFVATIANTPKVTTDTADQNSCPKANQIYWINWQSFELAANTSAQIVAPISSTLSVSFDVINTGNATVKADLIKNSEFGSSLCTGLVGNYCLQVTSNQSPITLIFDNIHLINTQKYVSYDYSIVIASVQHSSNAPANYNTTQQFTTNGSPWSLLAWAGVTTSPSVAYSNDSTTVTITTTSPVSGSPVFISDPPTQIVATFSNPITPFSTCFVLGILPTQVFAPSRGVNLFKK